jgi:hypothetical protein
MLDVRGSLKGWQAALTPPSRMLALYSASDTESGLSLSYMTAKSNAQGTTSGMKKQVMALLESTGKGHTEEGHSEHGGVQKVRYNSICQVY